MSLNSATRTSFIKLMLENSPSQKTRLIEMFESLSKKCSEEPYKSNFQEIATAIKNKDDKPYNLIKSLKDLNETYLNFDFSLNNSIIQISMPKFLAFYDSSNRIISKYSLQTTKLVLENQLSKNLLLANSVIISSSNGKAFIQQKPLNPSTLQIACLVTNPQIFDGNIYLIGNSVFHFKIRNGKLTTKLKNQDLKSKGQYNNSIKPHDNPPGCFCIEQVPFSYKNQKQTMKWVVKHDQKVQIGRGLHNKKTLKNKSTSYPLSLSEGMEFIMGYEKYVVHFIEE